MQIHKMRSSIGANGRERRHCPLEPSCEAGGLKGLNTYPAKVVHLAHVSFPITTCQYDRKLCYLQICIEGSCQGDTAKKSTSSPALDPSNNCDSNLATHFARSWKLSAHEIGRVLQLYWAHIC